MLQATNLSCIRQQKTIFTAISFTLTTHAVLLVEGPNGSGKSSLLRLLAGLSTPADGDIFWQNKSIQSSRLEYNAELHFIGHTNGIKLGLTVQENLQLTKQLIQANTHDFTAVLSRLQLNAAMQARYLSAGQKRRLALAKLFLFPKPLWLLDEPLTALDAHTQACFLSQLETHVSQGGMAIISTHQPLNFKTIAAKTLRLNAC